MNIPRPYRYSKYRLPQYTAKPPRSAPMREGEVLSGVIDGEPASDLEERFYIALISNPRVETVKYQPSFLAHRNMPGEIRPDFIVYSGGMLYPIQIDGAFTHHTAEQKAEDVSKDGMLDELLRGSGAYPTQRISGEYLQTLKDADDKVKELFG